MNKRCLAMMFVFSLLLTLPVFAVEEDNSDAQGTASFENIDARVKDSSPMILAYNEMIAAVDSVDRATAYSDLLDANNDLADVLWAFLQLGDTGAVWMIKDQQEQLKDQLNAYKTENYDKTYSDLVKPIENLSNLIIQGAQSLYLNISTLEQEIERSSSQLATMDRTVRETRVLYDLGRVSALDCATIEAARDVASRQLDVLMAQSRKMKMYLQFLIGDTPTGVLTLVPVPEVTQEQISSLQYDADLKAGIENSYDLYIMEQAVSDAKDTWDDADSGYKKTSAEHSYNAAVLALEAKKQAFQQSFNAVYSDIGVAQSAASAAVEDLAYQQKLYDAAQLRFSLGMISKSALLTAKANFAIAQLAEQTANIGLTSAYNTYCWARLGMIAIQA